MGLQRAAPSVLEYYGCAALFPPEWIQVEIRLEYAAPLDDLGFRGPNFHLASILGLFSVA